MRRQLHRGTVRVNGAHTYTRAALQGPLRNRLCLEEAPARTPGKDFIPFAENFPSLRSQMFNVIAGLDRIGH